MAKFAHAQSQVRAFLGISAVVLGGIVLAALAPVIPSDAIALPAAPIAAAQTVPPNLTWERTNPGGGGTIAMVGATANGTMITAADLSGVYLSGDSGESWTPRGSNQGLTNTHTSSLGFHPTDGNTFFVGTGWGAYKTTNLGDSFTQVQANGYIESFSFPKANNQIGYMAFHDDWDTSGEVYKSTNGGDTWGSVAGENLPPLRIVKVLAHPLDANVVYALGGKTRWGCSDAHLYRSVNGGVNWTRIGTAYPSILDIDVDPTNVNNVFITTFDSNPCAANQSMEDYVVDGSYQEGGLYRSTNGGTSFVMTAAPQPGIISVSDDAQTIRVITVLFPYSWNDNAGTWTSTDGGTNWTQNGHIANWNQGWVSDEYLAYAASFNGYNKTITKDIFHPERFYASFGQWSWASFDGGSTLNNVSTKQTQTGGWRSTGMENIVGHSLAVSASNPDVIYMGAYDIGFWTSLDRGASWHRRLPSHVAYPEYVWDGGEGSNVTALVADPSIDGVVWAVFHKEGFGNGPDSPGTNSALFKSTDYGQTWTKNTSLPDARFFYGLTIDPSSAPGSRTMFMTVEGDIFRSTNDGVDWSKVLTNGGLKFMAVDSQDPNLVYAGGENGLYRSTNGGGIGSWLPSGLPAMQGSLVGNFLPTTAGWEGVFDVVADPSVAGRVYVVAYGEGKGLYRSDTSGTSWEPIYSNDHMRGVAISPSDSNLIFATSSDSYHSGGADFAGSDGIVYSTNGGGTWTSASTPSQMAWPYGGRVRIAPGPNPYVIAWSPGTGLQMTDLVETDSSTGVTTIDPCVVWDSASANGGLAGPLTGGQQVAVSTTGFLNGQGGAANCGVPAGAAGVVVNVTAKNPLRAGNLRVFPAGQPSSGGVVNFAALNPSLNNSNAIIVPVSGSGQVSVVVNAGPSGAGSATTDVVLTVVGYLEPDGDLYTAVTPCAFADSRSGTGSFAGPYGGSTTRTVQLSGVFPAAQGGGQTNCGVPAGATSAMVNLVAVGPVGTGEVGVRGAASNNSTTYVGYSALNPSMNNSNAVIVPIDNGQLDLFTVAGAASSSHVRAVVLGYFATTGDTYTPLAPCVGFDSRPNQGGAGSLAGPYQGGESRTFQISGSFPVGQGGGNTNCGVPQNATSVMINIVAVNPLREGNLKAAANGTTPTGGILNFAALSPALNNSNAVIIPLSNGKIDVSANGGPGGVGLELADVRGVVLGYFTPS